MAGLTYVNVANQKYGDITVDMYFMYFLKL